MTKREKLIDTVYQTFTANFGDQDRYGNWIVKGSERICRIKPQVTSVRFELKMIDCSWFNIFSKPIYFKDLADTEYLNKLIAIVKAKADQPRRTR